MLALTAFVAAAVTLVVVLTSRGLLSDHGDARFLGANARARVASSVAADRVGAATPSAAAAPARAEPAAPRTWWSGAGAAGAVASGGTWGTWRGEPITVGATWDDSNQEMVEMRSICPGGTWARWNGRLDVAVGAIETNHGESWARAARGAYDARWVANLQRIKACWGKRDPALLYIRFAHEMNLRDMPWQVKGGEETDFVRALTRYSTLRYLILPRAKLVLCPSDGTSGGLGIDLYKLWPGKDSEGRQIVQVYAVDSYNSWVVARTAEEFQSKLFADQNGMPLGLEKHRLMAHDWGVPFAVPEWAGNGNPRDEGTGADLPIYVRLMNEWFRANAGDPRNPKPGQLLYENYFNDQDRFTLFPTRFQPQSAAQYRALTWGR